MKAPGLLNELYQAVEERTHWATFLGQLAGLFNANSASFRLVDLQRPTIHRSYIFGYKPHQDRLYQTHLVVHDPFREHLKRIGLRLTQSREAISDRELVRTEHYQRFFRHQDNFYAAGGHIAYKNGRAWQIGVHRSRRAGPFDSHELQLLEYFVPHLRRASGLMETIDKARQSLDLARGGLNALSFGVWLLDAQGRCQWMNQAAEAAIHDKNLGLIWRQGRLSHQQSHRARALQRALATALNTPPRSGRVLIDAFGRGILVTPITPAQPILQEHAGVMMLLLDPLRARLPNAQVLQRLYSLTPAEARLARALTSGNKMETICAEFGISTHTARSQLKAVMHKTGTHRQSELIRTLLLGPALVP